MIERLQRSRAGRHRDPAVSQHRGQTETVGVILLTAVVVVLVGGFGVYYLGASSDRASGQAPLVDAQVNATAERVVITHGGGQSVSIDALHVLVRGADTSIRYQFDATNITGDDGDNQFDPGERFSRDHSVGAGQLEVLLIHTPSNAVIERAYLDT